MIRQVERIWVDTENATPNKETPTTSEEVELDRKSKADKSTPPKVSGDSNELRFKASVSGTTWMGRPNEHGNDIEGNWKEVFSKVGIVFKRDGKAELWYHHRDGTRREFSDPGESTSNLRIWRENVTQSWTQTGNSITAKFTHDYVTRSGARLEHYDKMRNVMEYSGQIEDDLMKGRFWNGKRWFPWTMTREN